MKKSKNQSSVRVVVRIRPFNNKEKNSSSIIKANKTTIKLANKDTFTFDQVFNEESTQDDLYDDVGEKIVKNAFEGYNSCVFAYGQTGCFVKNTRIMMYNGSYKKIQNISLNDIIMGDDSTPRSVIKLFYGHEEIYKIKMKKKSYTINENHILVLYYGDQIVEIPLLSYLKLPDNIKKKCKCFTTSISKNYIQNLRIIKNIINNEDINDQNTVNQNTIKRTFKFSLKKIKEKLKLYNSQNTIHPNEAESNNILDSFIYILDSVGYKNKIKDNYLYITFNNTKIQYDENGNIKLVFNGQYIPIHNKYSFKVEYNEYGDYYGFMINGNHRFIGVGFNVLRNSGKSTSMFGDKIIGPGIIPRICDSLFTNQNPNNTQIKYQVEISYFEIYNEGVYDLLNPISGKLKVRQHPTYGPYVENLTQIMVTDSKSIMKLINQGNKERTTAATLMNNKSSRSHAIVTIYFTQIIMPKKGRMNIKDMNIKDMNVEDMNIKDMNTEDMDNEDDEESINSVHFDIPELNDDEPSLQKKSKNKPREIMSKINLVDLAGSERTELSQVVGENFKEAMEINKSLLTLGIVINSLAKSSVPTKKTKKGIMKKEQPVIQFRNSTLTWILKESLSGNSKTYMLANISPSSLYYDETFSTLTYAQNAKQIVNNVFVNENQNSKIINILKEEIKSLKDKLKNANSQDIREINEELEERETLIREKEKTWEQKLKDSMMYNEKIKQEFTIQQEELKQKLLLEMSGALSAIEEQKKQELDLANKHYEIKQNEFEKKKIVETAVELHKYYEVNINEIKKSYEEKELEIKKAYEEKEKELKIKELEIIRLAKEKELEKEQELKLKEQELKNSIEEREKKLINNALLEIEQLKNNNNLLKETLNTNQQHLQIQMRQYLNDRMVLTNQIQQLQAKLSYEETEELINIKSKKEDEEKQYFILKENCEILDNKLKQDTIKLNEIMNKHNTLLDEVKVLTNQKETLSSELVILKSEYEIIHLKLENDKLEYNDLLLKKEILHTELTKLKSQLINSIEDIKSNISEDNLLKIKNGFDIIYTNITSLND